MPRESLVAVPISQFQAIPELPVRDTTVQKNNSGLYQSRRVSDASGGEPSLSRFEKGVNTPAIGSIVKRREHDSELDEHTSKIQCTHDVGDIFKAANEGVSVLLSRERQKHLIEINNIQDRQQAEINRIRDEHTNEIKDIKAKHASDLEKQSASFERELGIRKAAEAEVLLKQKTEIEKVFQERIDVISARLDTAERSYRVALNTMETKLAEQDAKNREVSIKSLRTAWETRMEAITHQYQAEKKAHVAELVAGYQAREAGLKTAIAEKDAQLDTFKKCFESGEELVKTRDMIASLPHHVQSAMAQMTAFTTQAQLVHNQVQQLQGFINGLQSCAMPPRPQGPPGYWAPPHAMQANPGGPCQRHPPRDFVGPQ